MIGHSLGALKVAHYQALRQDPRVAGLVAASAALPAARPDPELTALAEKMEAEGRGQDLLPWGSSRAGAGTHSAATFLNRVGPAWTSTASTIRTPRSARSAARCWRSSAPSRTPARQPTWR